MTVDEFIEAARSFMDAEASTRWSDALITAIGGQVMKSEWNGILNQNQYYRLNSPAVTTDSAGRIAIADLTTGSADATKYFFRVVTGFTDGNILWKETDLRYVPLGTQSNYQNPYEYLYYLAGEYFQLLPVASGTSLTVDVNCMPPTIAQLASGSSTIDFPAGYEYILPWVAAGTCLLKGGAESRAAADLFALATDARKGMYAQIARMTTRPSSALFNDSPASWGG